MGVYTRVQKTAPGRGREKYDGLKRNGRWTPYLFIYFFEREEINLQTRL